MAYFKINGHDYSIYVNKLIIDTKHKYTARENAAGTLMVKYITKKKALQVGIIPLDADTVSTLLTDLNDGAFTKKVEFLNPQTNALEMINCIIPVNSIEYYTIQAGKTLTKAFTFTCEEL